MAAEEEASPSWYEEVEGGTLEQGDILAQCPVSFPMGEYPPAEGERFRVRVENYRVVLLSQTCDMTIRDDGRSQLDYILVSPAWTRDELRERIPEAASRNFLSEVIGQRKPTWHALAPSKLPGLESEHLFVQLSRMFPVPIRWAAHIAENQGARLRMLNPWKEHFSNAVGQMFSRVAIPDRIPPLPKD